MPSPINRQRSYEDAVDLEGAALQVPVVRLTDWAGRTVILTRPVPDRPDSSMLVCLRPGWKSLRERLIEFGRCVPPPVGARFLMRAHVAAAVHPPPPSRALIFLCSFFTLQTRSHNHTPQTKTLPPYQDRRVRVRQFSAAVHARDVAAARPEGASHPDGSAPQAHHL
jgi:hypothetical protein